VRPLFWYDSDDEQLWNVDDAFLLGDALLVCPIVEQGARSRTIILPQGRWYSFWDDAVFEGQSTVNIKAPLEQIPLLVKAGSILPMKEGQQLVLHLYPPIEGCSEIHIYSDAGDGYGEWRLEQYWLVRDEKGLELIWETQGEYAFPYQSVQLHLHSFEPEQVWVDGKEVAIEGKTIELNRFQQVRFEEINSGQKI
jgi:alpha-glucosidase